MHTGQSGGSFEWTTVVSSAEENSKLLQNSRRGAACSALNGQRHIHTNIE
jgi:hypothetical protein